MGPWPFLRVPGNGRTQSRTNDFCAPTASKASLRLDTNMNYHLCLRVTVWGGRQKIHSGDKSGQKGRWRNKTCQCCWKRPCSQKVPWCLFHSKKYECCLSDTGITREKYQFWLKCYINNLKNTLYYFIAHLCWIKVILLVVVSSSWFPFWIGINLNHLNKLFVLLTFVICRMRLFQGIINAGKQCIHEAFCSDKDLSVQWRLMMGKHGSMWCFNCVGCLSKSPYNPCFLTRLGLLAKAAMDLNNLATGLWGQYLSGWLCGAEVTLDRVGFTIDINRYVVVSQTL